MPTTRSTTGPKDLHDFKSNRLVLCFDGTGNQFQGTPGDTNIVKIYNMLDRGNTTQMHYYQPGIGTYPAEGPVNVSWFRTWLRKIGMVIDSGLATSFDSHVIAGYKFVMRYYKPGDRIYIFGFSRGAFTARFLARMISHVGLLSMGNEEMVPFAYQVYQEYEQNRGGTAESQQERVDFMNSFKSYFCRTEYDNAKKHKLQISENESGIKVHFLGLFDCVSSVGNLDIPFFQKTPPLPAVRGTAEHVRHAVAVDERRVKFKAALFSQEQHAAPEDIKEVWFPGNHGDIGGGWDVAKREDGKPRKDTDDDYFQLSDIALKWMVDEIDDVEKDRAEDDRFAWNTKIKADFLSRFEKHKDEMITARMHDTMTFAGGASSWAKVLLWKFMEYLPFLIKRWEYVKDDAKAGTYKWDYIGWPPNCGGRRDIPSTALFHHSIINRMRLAASTKKEDYRPTLYTPSNPLWVVSQGARTNGSTASKALDETSLAEIARHLNPSKDSPDSERARLVNSQPTIHFVHDEDATNGSVPDTAIDGVDMEWDCIYRAVKSH